MTRYIAEIGSNHNRDLDRCIQMIEASAAAGFGAVKVQVFRVDDLFAPEVLRAQPHLLARREWELPLAFLPPLRKACDDLGLELGATAFGLWAVDEVVPFVEWLKVASYELLWFELVRDCAATGKPLILSTGMSDLAEVRDAVSCARNAGCNDLSLLHCVSGYPTPAEQANLAAIETLRNEFACPVGWSDHTGSPAVVARAVDVWHADDVELHVDFDGTGAETGEHCWSFADVADLIASTTHPLDAAEASLIDGTGEKRPMPVELPDVDWRADPFDGLRPLRAKRAVVAATE